MKKEIEDPSSITIFEKLGIDDNFIRLGRKGILKIINGVNDRIG